ncbi:MAG: hypothetical protein P8Y28_12100 [Gammaproteobacteria bacterium]
MRKQAPLHMLYLLTFNLVLFYPVSVLAAENKEGKFYGAKMTEYPDWFKESLQRACGTQSGAKKHC